jgi:competence protein ComEC
LPEAAGLEYGNRIKVRGRVEERQSFSNPLLAPERKYYSIRACFYEKLSEGRGHPLKRAALWFSQRFNTVLERILPQKEASLLGSILLGGAVSPLPEETKETYRKSGLIHLLVVSGTQVSILIGICLAITKSMGLPLYLSVILTSLFNLLLVVVTGAGASILRAAVMGEITLIGMLFDRQKDFYNTLALSALLLLVFDPLILFDIGFQLSFSATWALVYIVPVLEKKMPALLAATLAPILATSPIIAFNFSQVSWGGIISNLLILPWVEFMVILGFSAVLLGFVFLPLAQIFGNTIGLMLQLMDRIAETIASLPGVCFYIQAPSFFYIAGYYFILIVLIELFKREKKIVFTRKRWAFALLLIFSLFVWERSFSAASPGGKEMTVTFLDVGQADCSLVELPDGKTVLIDGGGVERDANIRISENQRGRDRIGEKVVVPFLQRKGINKLDLVILTHPHADHLGGLISVLEKIKVDRVLDNGEIYASWAYHRFRDLVDANRIKYGKAAAGQIIDFGGKIKGDIFNPVFPPLGETNSDSVVMRLIYGNISFLFTGDAEMPAEERMLAACGGRLRSTVLKVGHHGSRTSTTGDFLKAVAPRIAVISVGKHNRYRHPAPSTIMRLRDFGIKTFRTDEQGAVEIRTNGREIFTSVQK